MSASKKKNLTIIALVAVGLVVAALWAWYDLQNRPANERIESGVRQILVKEPRVRPLYDQAMKDGVLTTLEATDIVNKAKAMKGR